MTTQTRTDTIKVIIAGVNGRMGRAFVQAFHGANDIQIVGAWGREKADYVGSDIAEVAAVPGSTRTGILVSSGFLECIENVKADVVLDFTQAEAAYRTANLALQKGIRPVIGTSGVSPEHVKELGVMAEKRKLGAMVVPNFSVGAVLMMEFARQAGRFLPNVEVVEMHHTGKVDAPSGTAMHTANKLASSRDHYNTKKVEEKELLPGARGGITPAGVRVHSLRLPGLISHQEVIFGAEGELLTIRHDSFNTKCFLEGIKLSLHYVMGQDRLVVGLDNVLFGENH